MDKSTIVGAALASFAGVVVIIGLCLFYFGGKSNGLASPEALYDMIVNGSEDEQEMACLDLGRYGPDDARAPQAKEILRKVLKESSAPRVKAAALNGLSSYQDWDSIPEVLDALEDSDEHVRLAAGKAYNSLVGVFFNYDAKGEVENRKELVGVMKLEGMTIYKRRMLEKKNKG